MHINYVFTVERQTAGLAWAKRIGTWAGIAVMLIGIPVVLDAPGVGASWPWTAVFLWLGWSGAFAQALAFALPALYIRLHGRIRVEAARLEVSPAGLRIEGSGFLAWHSFAWLAGKQPNTFFITRHDRLWLKFSGPDSQACLAALSQHCPPRRLPDISPEGCLPAVDDEGFSGGAILLQRHGGTDVLYGFDAEQGLAACAAQTSRILLGHAAQTFADRRNGAVANALVMAMLATLPALALGAMLGRDAGLPLCIAVVVGAAIWGAHKEMATPGGVWTRSEWLDLENRTWNARRDFPDHALPMQRVSLPFVELALVCFTQNWEQGVSHDVGLCKARDLNQAERAEPPVLNMLHSADNPADAARFAMALGNMWGIPCWQIEGGLSIRKWRLD